MKRITGETSSMPFDLTFKYFENFNVKEGEPEIWCGWYENMYLLNIH